VQRPHRHAGHLRQLTDPMVLSGHLHALAR
jgi:hypothetical protein